MNHRMKWIACRVAFAFALAGCSQKRSSATRERPAEDESSKVAEPAAASMREEPKPPDPPAREAVSVEARAVTPQPSVPASVPVSSSPSLRKAADWPQWRGPGRDGLSTETGLLKKWPEAGPRLLWTARDIGKGFSTVAVADGLVYATGLTGQDDTIFAFDLAGKLQWKRNCGPGWSKSHPGVRSTATVDGGLVYVMTGGGTLACFDAKTGAPEWSVDTVKEFGGAAPKWGFAESVLIVGDAVICTPGGSEGTVVALDRKTGETLWASKGSGERSGYCSPILIERGGRQLIVTMTERSIVGLDAGTGEVLWTHEHVNKWNVNANTPIHENGLIFVTSGYGKGSEALQLSPDGTSVEKRWTDKKLDCHHGGAVLVDGHVYASASKGKKWICLDLATGKAMHEAQGVGKGSVTYADGMLYCYGESGRVGLVQAKPDGHNMVSSFSVDQGSGEHWAHPVVSGGRLYIRHGDVLMAYEVRAK